MANDFNPSPGPPNDPNYMGYSKPIAPYEADRGTGIALDTAAGGLTGGLKAVDESMKQGIQDKLHDRIDKQRDQYTEGLEALNKQLKSGAPAVGTADSGQIAAPVRTATDGVGGFGPTAPKSIFDANASADMPEDTLPVGLQDGLDRFSTLAAAKQAGSVKLNDTQYAGNILSIAKELRNQYPGYREYIDEQTSKISGLPVANSYYQNMLLDINRQLSQQKAGKDDFSTQMTKAMDAGMPHMSTYMQMRATKDSKYPGDGKVLDSINQFYTDRASLEVQSKQRSEADWNEKNVVRIETQNVTKNANALVKSQINDNLMLSGMPTLKDTMGYVDDVLAKRIPISEKEVAARGNQLQVYRNYLSNKMDTDNADSRATIGQEAYNKLKNAALEPLDHYIELASQKEGGPMAQLALQMSNHIKNDDEYSWLTDDKTGVISRMIVTARKTWGDQYFPTWIKAINQNNLDEPLAQRFSQEAIAAIQPPNIDPTKTTKPRVMKDAIAEAKVAGADGKGVPNADFYGHVTGLVTGITDPTMPQGMKDRLIDWTFNPKNSGVLNEFKQDYKNPTTGEWVKGKEAAFTRMTAPAISQAVADTAKAKPENYTNYLNWTRTEWANAYREDLQQLDQWKFSGSSPGVLSDKPSPYHPAWNNSSKQIVLVDRNNNPVDRNKVAPQLGMQPYFDKLDTVNRGLNGLNSAYMYSPGRKPGDLDVDGYILQTIKPFLSDKNQKGFLADMGRAVIKTNKPEMTMKDIDQMLFGNAP